MNMIANLVPARSIARPALAGLVLVLATIGGLAEATAQSRDRTGPQAVRITDAVGAREVRLQVSKSVVLELPRDAADILVSNPSIGNAIAASS